MPLRFRSMNGNIVSLRGDLSVWIEKRGHFRIPQVMGGGACDYKYWAFKYVDIDMLNLLNHIARKSSLRSDYKTPGIGHLIEPVEENWCRFQPTNNVVLLEYPYPIWCFHRQWYHWGIVNQQAWWSKCFWQKYDLHKCGHLFLAHCDNDVDNTGVMIIDFITPSLIGLL